MTNKYLEKIAEWLPPDSETDWVERAKYPGVIGGFAGAGLGNYLLGKSMENDPDKPLRMAGKYFSKPIGVAGMGAAGVGLALKAKDKLNKGVGAEK